MIHNQFCQSSSRPHIPHHFKWPSSIFQVAENVCHEIIRGSFHCIIRKSEGVIFSPLVQKILMGLENRKWGRSLHFRRLNQNPERLLSLGYIVPGVPSIYQMDAVRHRFHKAEKQCCCLHFRFRYCHAFALFHETHHWYLPQQEGFENLLFPPDAGIHIDEHQVHQATTDHIVIKLLIRFSLSVIPSLLMLIY